MKNTNNKSLNDLFRAARDEASTELLSDREAEKLLVNGTMRSLPTKQTIGQQLYALLFATPLKIGITTMTTATCIALGVFAFWPQTSVTNNSLASISQGTKTTYGTYGTNKSTETAIVAAPKSLPQTIIDKAPVFHSADALLPAPIASADSLHPIELSPEQLAQLGIVLEDNGDIDFYTKSGSTGEVNKFGLPPTWGVRLHLGEKISDADIAGVTIPKSAPRLVTEPDGAKRLFSFQTDTSFTKTDGNRKILMQISNEMQIAPGRYDSLQNNLNDERVLVHVYGDSNLANGTKVDHGIDSNFKFLDPEKNWNANIRVTVNDDYNNVERIMNAVHDMDHADSEIHKIELTIDELHSENASSDIDAELIAANESHDQAWKLFKKLGKALAKKNVNEADLADRIPGHLNNENFPTDRASSETIQRGDTIIRKIKALGLIESDTTVGSSRIAPINMMDQITNSISLDHLIPIRVRNMKNAEHPNELIFWYEPTPEVTAAIPDASVSQPAPQSKQLAISVYPNPTNGPATIHFSLAGVPKAYFSVRNLLGQQVLDGGTTSGTSGDMKLDLSSLDAGVYLLVTTTDDGERDVERVVVAK